MSQSYTVDRTQTSADLSHDQQTITSDQSRTLAPPPLQLKASQLEGEEEVSTEEIGEKQFSAASPSEPPPSENDPEDPGEGIPIQRKTFTQSGVIQRDKDREAVEFLEGKDFKIEGDNLHCLRTWLEGHKGSQSTANRLFAPKAFEEIILELKSQGYLYWLNSAQIKDVSKKIFLPNYKSDPTKPMVIVPFDILTNIIAETGLPDDDPIKLHFMDHGIFIQIAGQMIPEDKGSKQIEFITKIVDKLSADTSLSYQGPYRQNLINYLKEKQFDKRWDGKVKVFEIDLDRETCQLIFGQKAWDDFYEGLETGIGNQSSPKDGKDTGNKTKAKEPWTTDLEERVNSLIKVKRNFSTDIGFLPDKFYVKWREPKWRGVAKLNKGKPDGNDLLRTINVNQDSDPRDVLDKLLTLLRASYNHYEFQEKRKERAELKEEQLWAEKLRQEISRLVKKERGGWRQPQHNSPDILSLEVEKDSEGQDQIYLIVSVRAKVEDKQTARISYDLRSARIPQPLTKPADIKAEAKKLFPITKKLALSLHEEKDASKTDGNPPPEAKRIQEAFPSHINAKNFRDDFITVTNGKHEFFMGIEYQEWYRDGIESTSEAMATSYVWWNIYRIPTNYQIEENQENEGTPEPKPTQKTLSEKEKWLARRQQLQQHFYGQRESIPKTSGITLERSYGGRLHHDLDISIPSDEGIYLVYAHCQIKPSNKRYVKPSYAVFVLKAVDGYGIARKETMARYDEMERRERAWKNTPEGPLKKQALDRYEEIRQQEESKESLFDQTDKTLEEIPKKVRGLNRLKKVLQKKERIEKSQNISLSIHKLIHEEVNGSEGQFQFVLSMWREIQGFMAQPGYTNNPIRAIEYYLSLLSKTKKGVSFFSKKINKYRDDFKPGVRIYSPVATIASQYTGKTHSLTLILGEAKSSSGGRIRFDLIDVSNPNDTEKYKGYGSTKLAAIHDAFDTFAKNNDYGNGYLVWRVPGVRNLHTPQKNRNKPGFRKRALQVLKAIAMIGGIAAIAISAVATGGTSLALLGTVLGVAAGVSGGILAAENTHNRVENHRFSFDAEFALDVLSMVGGAASFIGGAGTFIRAGKAAEASGKVNRAGRLTWPARASQSLPNWVKRVDELEGMLVFHSTADFVGNSIFLPLKLKSDLEKIDALDLPDHVKKAMKDDAIGGAMISGFMTIASGASTAKDIHDQMQSFRSKAMGKQGTYIKSMQEAGILGADGEVIGASKTKAEDAAEVSANSGSAGKKPITDAQTETNAPAKTEPKPESDTGRGNNSRFPKEPEIGGGDGGSRPPKKENSEGKATDPTLTEEQFVELEIKRIQDRNGELSPQKREAETARLRQRYKEGYRYDPQSGRLRRARLARTPLGKQSASRRARAARKYKEANRDRLEAGDPAALYHMLDMHGNWKDMMLSLSSGNASDKAIARQMTLFRQKVIDRVLKGRFGTDKVGTLGSASTKAESDVDLFIGGEKGGENLLKAEKQMRDTYGADWQEKFRMSLFSDPKRLGRAHEAGDLTGQSTAGRARTEARITDLAETLSFAQMLRSAKGNKAARRRVEGLMKAAGVDPVEVKALARMSKANMQKQRESLLKEIDALEAQYKTATGEEKVRLGEAITHKQMQVNFMTSEAYISPGAIKSLDPKASLSSQEAYQSMSQEIANIEALIKKANGDVMVAMQEYEFFKYMMRFSQANGDKQMDLFFDGLAERIATYDRQGAKNLSEQDLRTLWSDFEGFVYRAMKRKKIQVILDQGGSPGGLTKKWDAPDLTAQEMVDMYRASGVDRSKPFTDAELKEKYDAGLRFNAETRGWNKPFKSGKKKEISFEDIQGKTAAPEKDGVPASQLGLDAPRLTAFEHLDTEAVARILSRKNLDQIKGQLAEEISNKQGTDEASQTRPIHEDGQVAFFRGDQVAGPAPTGDSSGNQRAALTDGLIAEVRWKKNGDPEVYIHQIYEVKSGHASAEDIPGQVEWGLERIMELGLSLHTTKPDGSVGWIDFDPRQIKMRPRNQQKSMVKAFTPGDVSSPKGSSTRAYTAKNLPGITAEDLHLAALMILRKLGHAPSGSSGSQPPEQLPLPLFEQQIPAQRATQHPAYHLPITAKTLQRKLRPYELPNASHSVRPKENEEKKAFTLDRED
ncbi:MAG: hypothetical protein AAF587_02695 [Bacteroidota bacterium]